jgi:hypothetical protein
MADMRYWSASFALMTFAMLAQRRRFVGHVDKAGERRLRVRRQVEGRSSMATPMEQGLVVQTC